MLSQTWQYSGGTSSVALGTICSAGNRTRVGCMGDSVLIIVVSFFYTVIIKYILEKIISIMELLPQPSNF